MNKVYQTLSHAPLFWTDDLPAAFNGVHLPGATIASSSGLFGSVSMQEFRSDQYTIRYNVLDIFQRFILKTKKQDPGLYAQVILKGRVQQQINTVPAWVLTKNQFSLIQGPSLNMISTYDQPTSYISFDTFFSMKLVNELLPLFPSLVPVLNKESFTSSKLLIQPILWANTETLSLIQSILNCKYQNGLRLHFFNHHIRDLLVNFFIQWSSYDPVGKQPSEKEIVAIHKAEQMISQDISQHIYVEELAKRVHMNEYRFKVLFNQIFGTGPYDYLIRLRMKKGLELLEAGYLVKEAAAHTGYRPSDFTMAFINHYGFGPGLVKKRN